MVIDLTDEERKLLSSAVAMYVEDATSSRVLRQVKPEFRRGYLERLSQIERLNYTKLNPEALVGDLELPDGTILKKGV